MSAVRGSQTYRVFGAELALTATEAYLENAETIPKQRGRGLASVLLAQLLASLRARGVQTTCALVRVDNAASRRMVEKCGLRQAGVLVSRRRLGRWLSDYSCLQAAAIDCSSIFSVFFQNGLIRWHWWLDATQSLIAIDITEGGIVCDDRY
ncbi:MAG: GNAT family N-acetyltransferase [Armatimonadota bacterium]